MRILKTVKEDSCIYIVEEFADDGSDKGGLYEWFNYKGYTYVRDERD